MSAATPIETTTATLNITSALMMAVLSIGRKGAARMRAAALAATGDDAGRLQTQAAPLR